MSLPNSADFALVKVQTAAGPPSFLALLCGIDSASIARAVQQSESYRRDCAAPNRPGQRKIRVTGSSWSVSASGADNIDIEETYDDCFGVRKIYHFELYKDDGTDGGELLGYYLGTAIMTGRNQGYTDSEAGTTELTLEGEGELVWTPAP